MLRVGVIDSGPGPDDPLEPARAFLADGAAMPARLDRLGHGTAVAAIIRRACPGAAVLHAQVFDDRPLTSALRVAAALRWFGSMGSARPEVICMSLGLGADRAPLRAGCAALLAQGAVLVAAHPARGAPCFPAAYSGVVAATGDARCGWDELSHLGPALFGAWCNSPEHGPRGMGGASLGAARVAGHLAAIMAKTGRLDGPAAIAALAARAIHHGPERRRGHG
ncbi:subtilisin-like serine protease QhpE [Paracoccus yeei]|uniref:Subtilisin n=1 Tax=Paracoccus yeei TaxID=147645 RepID=A0A2D2C5K7_9RHOB|nr:subtilisin [Paracoccus yeei]ATQ57784.1 subtilisin [Paracoccus yeei]